MVRECRSDGYRQFRRQAGLDHIAQTPDFKRSAYEVWFVMHRQENDLHLSAGFL